MRPARRWLVWLCVVWLAGTLQARADDSQGFVAIINEENDRFVIPATDKHYTQGLHVTLLWPDNDVWAPLKPLSWLPDFGIADATRKFGLAIGQDIYTPEDTDATSLIVTDRPYAGWLYLGFIREVRGTTCGSIPTLDHLELDLGCVGPSSLAEDSQTWFHDLIKAKEANGWDNQLQDEPGLLIVAERRWLLWDSGDNDGLKAQMIPKFTLKLGNVETSAKFGALLRLGHHIPDEFGKMYPRRYGWYVFSEIDARGVLYNEFLDGNLFHGSHSVDKEPAVVEAHVGVAFVLKRIEFRYTYNYLTREFKLQEKYDAYGSLDLICRF